MSIRQMSLKFRFIRKVHSANSTFLHILTDFIHVCLLYMQIHSPFLRESPAWTMRTLKKLHSTMHSQMNRQFSIRSEFLTANLAAKRPNVIVNQTVHLEWLFVIEICSTLTTQIGTIHHVDVVMSSKCCAIGIGFEASGTFKWTDLDEKNKKNLINFNIKIKKLKFGHYWRKN